MGEKLSKNFINVYKVEKDYHPSISSRKREGSLKTIYLAHILDTSLHLLH